VSHDSKKYLVMVDPAAPMQPALERAVPMALEAGARLEIYACDVADAIPPGWAEQSQALQLRVLMHQRRLQDLERLARPLRCLGLAVSTVDECGDPIEPAIAQHLSNASPDLIIKESPGRAQARSWHHCTDRVLAQHAPCPVFIVGAGSS
jgi:nucleotide-binding universal stress UspA family protein